MDPLLHDVLGGLKSSVLPAEMQAAYSAWNCSNRILGRDAGGSIRVVDATRAALGRIGAARPTWVQGQREYTHDGHFFIARTQCVQCARPLKSSTVRGYVGMYCSEWCRLLANHGLRMTPEEYAQLNARCRCGPDHAADAPLRALPRRSSSGPQEAKL